MKAFCMTRIVRGRVSEVVLGLKASGLYFNPVFYIDVMGVHSEMRQQLKISYFGFYKRFIDN